MLSVFDKLPKAKKDIHEVFRAVIKTECDFKIRNREEIKSCRVCKTPLQLEEKWLLELP